MKHVLLLAPLLASGLVLGACTSDDLESFANGLDSFAYELDNQLNPPCPSGTYRAFVPDTLATSYPQYPYQQVGYQITPGGYSYCAFPVTTPYYSDYDDDDHHHRGHDKRGDDDYRDGYRDGYRYGQRDD